jgi:hypothetical protein
MTVACILARGGADVTVCRTRLRILPYGRIISLVRTLTLTFLSMTNQPLRFFSFSCTIILIEMTWILVWRRFRKPSPEALKRELPRSLHYARYDDNESVNSRSIPSRMEYISHRALFFLSPHNPQPHHQTRTQLLHIHSQKSDNHHIKHASS